MSFKFKLYLTCCIFLVTNMFFVRVAKSQGTPTFSIDFQGPLNGTADGFFVGTIREGDILTVSPPSGPGPNPPVIGPIPRPGIMVSSPTGGAGTFPGGLGLMPTISGFIEIDAISFGKDVGDKLHFSVDEFSVGLVGVAPNVFSEGAGGSAEASSDVFMYLGAVVSTNVGAPIGNIAIIDGNGLIPSGSQGLGLTEPNLPNIGVIPDLGDNLDALDIDTLVSDFAGRIYFSLDSTFADPLELGVPLPLTANSGSAAANGFSGADILSSNVSGVPTISIPAAALGLDLGGFDTDDLDALSFDDADASGDLTVGDFILFSVRRGSTIIGVPDSMYGVNIEEGDILTLPVTPGMPPAIFIPAERLGLATLRSGSVVSDDLGAIDLSFVGLSDLEISKTAPVMAIPGSSISYTIVATNTGPSEVVSAQVTDMFSADLTACTWTCAGTGGGTCPAAGTGNISALVNLPVGGSSNFAINCDIISSATGALSNLATVSTPALIFDPNMADNSSSVTTTLTPNVDLSITKTDNKDLVVPPTSLTYVIVVQNSGPSDAVDASVDDSFPVEVTNINWTCTSSVGSVCNAYGVGDIHEVVSILAGGNATFVATVDTNGIPGDVAENTVTVSAAMGYFDPNLTNNSATDITNYMAELIFENGFEE